MKAEHKDEGKLRLDLIPPSLNEEVAKVLGFGAKKYSDNNWRKGMDWMKIYASIKRHLHEWEKCNDTDIESGLPHLGHAACDLAFLIEYAKTHPHLDNRIRPEINHPKVALDIDNVLANFSQRYCDWFGIKEIPTSWNFDPEIGSRLQTLANNYDFWIDIRPLPQSLPEMMRFEPVGYVTSRVVSSEITTEWLRRNNYPLSPVITVGHNESKVEALKRLGAEIFVDDRWENYLECNRGGIFTYLFDAKHNQRYKDARRIKSIAEL